MSSKKVMIGSAIGGALLAAGTATYLKNRKTIPEGIEAIKDFDANKYLGKWYEIARLDFYYEKCLNNTTAEYSLNEDGSIKVVNSGHNYKKKRDKVSVGKAKFIDSPNEGKLKVSFFGPFYAGYNIIEIDPEYKYALVAGRNHNYLWLLSRETSLPENIKRTYIDKAKELGYKVEELFWVTHGRN